MITEAWIDATRLHGDPPQSFPIALSSLDGLGSPSPRDNRPERSRRHGVIDLTTYYSGRVLNLRGKASGPTQLALWTTVDDLKRQFALNGLTHVFKVKRAGLSFLERCVVSVSSPLEVEMRVVGEIVTWSVVVTAADPRLYVDTPSSISFAASGNASNGGNFNTYPVVTFHGGGTNPGLRNNELSADNVIQMAYVMGGSDTIVVDMAAHTVKLNGADRPDILDVAASAFWGLVSGSNSLTKVGGAVSVDVAWRDARI